MEPTTLHTFLRVLYTVNNNPQYILAKSSTPVPAIVCSEQSSTNEFTYARTPLKACLVAVCDSSPELLQDPIRDFSLYVLDPLEEQPSHTNLTRAPHNTSLPRGVAVALGLMSWALESTDPTNVLVTGTIIPNAPPALEVIFALRETNRVPKPMLHAYPSYGPIPATGSSQRLDPHDPQAARVTWSSASQVQRDQLEQRTLTRSADFPELYIGPPRRAPGRPEGSTSKTKVKSQASISSLPGNPSKGADPKSESKQEVRRKSKQKTKPKLTRAPPTQSPFICEPLMRDMAPGTTGVPAFYHQSHLLNRSQNQPLSPQNQSYTHPTQNPLLGLLSAIASTSSATVGTNATPVPQVGLLSALQGLLAANPHLLESTAAIIGSSVTTERSGENKLVCRGSKAEEEDDDANSDIVILDSSTIDTTAFRKLSCKNQAASDTETPLLAINQGTPAPSVQNSLPSPLPASMSPSGQEGTPASSQTSTPTVILESKTPTTKHVFWERTENITLSQVSGIPATPTPRVHKRKLDEYIQGQAHLSTHPSPPSPSPSATRTCLKRASAAKRILSSPTRGTKSSLSARLPSMLGSMLRMATSDSRLQVGSLTRGPPASLVTTKNIDLLTALASGPSKPKADHPEGTTTSPNVTSDTTSLKRTLNLNLNEVMEEQEARKKAKLRNRSPSGRKLEGGVPANTSRAGAPRYSQLSTLRHAQSSPPRPLCRSNPVASSLPAPIWSPALATGASISSPLITASAGTEPGAKKNPLKTFVIPAWARTNTAMLPRLSEEALARQRAEQDAKRAQVSLRRREAAKAKRKRRRDAERPSKESSDEDDDAVTNDPKPRPLHALSSVARSAPLPPPPPPSLPVFASNAVAPIPPSPSPPQSHGELPPVPSTPPRKPVSPASALRRTPNKSGSCSLFTPSGREPGSLFTPSTPGVTHSLTRAAFTPHSPTILHRSGVRISPRKSVPQTPKRNGASHQTPRSLRCGRNAPFTSPSLAMRMPQTQMGMGTRTFLLPPPSPCASQLPRHQSQTRAKGPGNANLAATTDSEIMKQEPQDKENHEGDKSSKERDALLGTEMPTPSAQCSPTRLTIDDGQGTSELCGLTFNGDASHAGDEYASSPLPPSSPLPASPFSSPAKQHDSDVDPSLLNNLVVPNSDILLPSASDSDGPKGGMDINWLSDDASWLTNSEANAWLTGTDAWLTDTGGPLLTDSDGAWLSDSDAVFGDMSSIPPSSASNWFSDDADIDTDCEGGAGIIVGSDGAFDTATFETAFAVLMGRSVAGMDEGGSAGTHGTKAIDSEFWESIRPLLGENAVGGESITPGNAGECVGEGKVAQDLQTLLNGLS